jgi:hypothetical protein
MMLAARRHLRLRLRDLAAASAFTAVGLSGSVPLWVAALFAIAFIASMLGYRPLTAQRAWAVITLLAIGLGLFGLVFFGRLDLVVAAVSFAALVTAHRLVSEPSTTTDQQVLLASLLLMAGAAALSGELPFALCLLAFGVFSCLHLGLAVIEGPVERDEALPMAPVLRQVSLGVGVALLGGIAFFVLFPRLSWNLASRRSSPGLLGGSTGMSDRVRLGGNGDIKTSARVVLRARLEPDPGVKELDQYWIGRRFDRFDGREWRGSGVDGSPGGAVHLANAGSGQVVQRIELLPAYGARTLVALAHPASFSRPVAITPTGSVQTLIVNAVGEEVRFLTSAPSYAYTAISVRGSWMRNDELEHQRALAVPTLDPPGRSARAPRGRWRDRPPSSSATARALAAVELRVQPRPGGRGERPLGRFSVHPQTRALRALRHRAGRHAAHAQGAGPHRGRVLRGGAFGRPLRGSGGRRARLGRGVVRRRGLGHLRRDAWRRQAGPAHSHARPAERGLRAPGRAVAKPGRRLLVHRPGAVRAQPRAATGSAGVGRRRADAALVALSLATRAGHRDRDAARGGGPGGCCTGVAPRRDRTLPPRFW